MLIYLIDAFNLIHKIEPVLDSQTPHDDFVRYILSGRLTGSRTNRVVVVFDGYEPRGQFIEGGVEIVFSKAKTADDVIKERVASAKNKKQFVVVSDDRSIRDFAGAEGAHVLSSAEFLRKRGKKRRSGEREDEKKMDNETREDITRELGELWK